MPDSVYPGPHNIQRHVLENGIVVLLYENFAAASVVVDGFLGAGALADGRERAGLADFVANMLLRGASRRPFEEIYGALEAVGAGLDFSAGRHVTGFSGGGLAEDLALVLDLLSDSLRRPTFPNNEIEQVRGETLTGLQIRASDTRQMANLRFREMLYEDHPYGYSVHGYPKTIAALDREDLATFHTHHYGPQEMVIAIVGAVRAQEALERVEEAFGDWQNELYEPALDVPTASRPVVTVRDYVSIPDKTQTDIVLGLPGPPRAAEDFLDASMANTILGVFGMMGRLGNTVREDLGLAYYIYSRLQGGKGPAPWYVATGVAPEVVDQALASILSEIDRLQTTLVPETELEDSKMYRTGSLPVSLETNSGLASVITDIEFYELGLDYLQRFPALINDITAERVQAAAQKYFSTEQLAISMAGPPEVSYSSQ